MKGLISETHTKISHPEYTDITDVNSLIKGGMAFENVRLAARRPKRKVSLQTNTGKIPVEALDDFADMKDNPQKYATSSKKIVDLSGNFKNPLILLVRLFVSFNNFTHYDHISSLLLKFIAPSIINNNNIHTTQAGMNVSLRCRGVNVYEFIGISVKAGNAATQMNRAVNLLQKREFIGASDIITLGDNALTKVCLIIILIA